MSSKKITDLDNKKFVCIVAHQDDETLYCGGLLSIHNPLSIACVTLPWPGTPYSVSRTLSFNKVCSHLGAACEQWGFTDCGTSGEVKIPNGEFEQLVLRIRKMVDIRRPDFILTHSDAGEANRVYPRGHAMHKIVNRAVCAAFQGDVLACAMGKPMVNYDLDYDRATKQLLFDYYLPEWDPYTYNFDFAMHNERYVWVQRQKPMA